jgi:hypothetical protein
MKIIHNILPEMRMDVQQLSLGTVGSLASREFSHDRKEASAFLCAFAERIECLSLALNFGPWRICLGAPARRRLANDGFAEMAGLHGNAAWDF